MSIEDEAKAALRRAEDAVRTRTPERIALRIAVVGWVVCALFGFILGHIH